ALKGLEWGSIWKLSGNVLEERYRVISLQFETLRHLKNEVEDWSPELQQEKDDRVAVLDGIRRCQEKSTAFVKWFVRYPMKVEDLTSLREFQEELAAMAGLLMRRILVPAWHKEKESLIFDRSRLKEVSNGEDDRATPTGKLPPHVQVAEEFFVLPYLAF